MTIPAIEYRGDRPCLPPEAYPVLRRLAEQPCNTKPRRLRRLVAAILRAFNLSK